MYRLRLAALTMVVTAAASAQTPLGPAFTFQGQLNANGNVVNTPHDFQFRLFDAPGGGIQIGNPDEHPAVGLADGVFSIQLNDGGEFGPVAFTGDARWLEIWVKASGDPTYTLLTPRQPLTATPYALFALNAPPAAGFWQANGTDIFNANAGDVGVGTPAPAHKLHVVGDSFTSGRVFVGAPGGDTNVKRSATGSFAQALNWDPPSVNAIPGVWVETVTGSESGGFYADGDIACIWSPGDPDLLRIYDEDDLPSGLPKLTVAGDGDLVFRDDESSIRFPNAGGSSAPMIYLFGAPGLNSRMVLGHSPGFPTWGLQYEDASDKFHFMAAGQAKMTIELASGEVGIGTTTPTNPLSVVGDADVSANLDVGGDVRVGAANLQASAGPERLRIVRGNVSAGGTITAGAGFTVQLNSLGDYTIFFNPPFTGVPSVTVTTRENQEVASHATIFSMGTSWVSILTWREALDQPLNIALDFSFIAIGPR